MLAIYREKGKCFSILLPETSTIIILTLISYMFDVILQLYDEWYLINIIKVCIQGKLVRLESKTL